MRVFLTGVGCVGKTTIGARLAALLDYSFVDLDAEIESYFATSIERLRSRYLTPYSFRKEASKALQHVLSREGGRDCVIVLPPSGLMDGYWRVVKRSEGTIVVIRDEPENIVKRIVFYDIDSRPIHKILTEKERGLYVREIRKDITYFGRTYRRAHITVDIAGLAPDDAARKVAEAVCARRLMV
ncbi:MAG: shikimate kinase [Gammaproteobacteria bacterium]